MLKALFRQLQGTWALDRQLESSNAAEPSGRCQGEATFSSRSPSDVPGFSNQDFTVEEMLYQERGEFELEKRTAGSNILTLPFSRKYVWRLTTSTTEISASQPVLSVWFTKPGTDDLDYLFHEVKVEARRNVTDLNLVADGEHLCVNDMYYSKYEFEFRVGEVLSGAQNATLADWRAEHLVKGPTKDQLIRTSFHRPT